MLITSLAPLPVPNPTTSYWQLPPSRLQKFRSTPTLPNEAEYIIIGGGISGSSLAYQILEKEPGAKVLLLEARDACSGASGRNGGHCRPGRYQTFVRDTNLHSLHEATSIARFEETNVRQLAAFANKHKISCTLEPVITVDLYETGTEAFFSDTLAAIAARKVALASDIASGNADERTIYTAAEAREKFNTPNAIGAVSFPAYSINPYQFVCGVLELALAKGLNLQTGTTVDYIQPENAEEGVWKVSTARGDITTRNLLLATNGYTSYLFPPASSFIKPVRNQAVALQSGSTISQTPLLENHSICFAYPANKPGAHGDDYMVSKPPKELSPNSSSSTHPRDLILGGGRHFAPNNEEYNTDDSSIDANVAAYLRTTLQTQHFGSENWGEPGAVLREWTGIVGHTPDENPVLGPVPGCRGLWICAGFTGHGMALAFRSADAVSSLVLGRGKDVEEWVPKSFLCGRKGVEVVLE